MMKFGLDALNVSFLSSIRHGETHDVARIVLFGSSFRLDGKVL
jgi:hypothetical protein